MVTCEKANPKRNRKQPTPTRRPANPPARFAFRRKHSKPDRKRGKSPTQTPTKERICQRHSGIKTTASTTKTSRRTVFRACVLHNFIIIIRSTSIVFRVYFVWENQVFLCSMHKMMWKLGCVFGEKNIFRLCFHPILTENYVKFNIVWNRLCPHNLCHRIKMGKTKRGLRGIFIIIFVQKLSNTVRI